MKSIITILIFILLSFSLTGCSNNNSNNISDTNIIDFSRLNSNADTSNFKKILNLNDFKEIEISSFSTPLGVTSSNLSTTAANRITNIKLTSNKINEYILQNGDTFSFNEIVGPCTAEEGYKKSEVFVNKQIQYALGGGNCQVSTTLYNAALAVEGITIIERHEHSKNVPYIEDGKDATISYDTLDLKFKNETGNILKLYTWCDDINVYAKICKIEQ